MKLLLEIDGTQTEVEFAFTPPAASLTIKGQTFVGEASEPEPGLFVILLNGRVYRCTVDRPRGTAGPSGETSEVSVNGQRLAIGVRDLKHLRGANAAGGGADGPATLRAPMPGKVVRVLCAEGDEVVVGQGVMIVEAMKMQNEVQTPRAGKLTSLRAKDGQTVNAGEILAIIE